MKPVREAKLVARLTRDKSQRFRVRYLVRPHTFVSPSADSNTAVISYCRKYVHEVLANRLGGLSLPRKSVVKLTDRTNMNLAVYRGRNTTTTTTEARLWKVLSLPYRIKVDKKTERRKKEIIVLNCFLLKVIEIKNGLR